MQIRHNAGLIELRDVRMPSGPDDGPNLFTAVLTEEEAGQLLENNGAALRQALNEARAHNVDGKRRRIDRLRAEADQLEATLRPAPLPRPVQKEVRG